MLCFQGWRGVGCWCALAYRVVWWSPAEIFRAGWNRRDVTRVCTQGRLACSTERLVENEVVILIFRLARAPLPRNTVTP